MALETLVRWFMLSAALGLFSLGPQDSQALALDTRGGTRGLIGPARRLTLVGQAGALKAVRFSRR